MAYVLIKRGKFLEGWSYCTGFGYSFTWTHDEAGARRFGDGEIADHIQAKTGGRFEHRKNTRAELRVIAKERQRIAERGFTAPSVHSRINRRAALATHQAADGAEGGVNHG